nr:hypothetical protein L203_03390 [Cryptococcus depauperatus CBS 7841]
MPLRDFSDEVDRSEACQSSKRAQSGGSGQGEGSNTLVNHLESQLSSLQTEISNLYRTQAAGQNKQLTLADALRERDEEVMNLRDQVRSLKNVQEKSAQNEKQWEEKWKLREEDIQTMADEIMSLNLELSAVTARNEALLIDNSNLLQRWLDKMNFDADMMNDEFEKEMEAAGNSKDKEGDGEEGFEEVEIFVDAPNTTPNKPDRRLAPKSAPAPSAVVKGKTRIDSLSSKTKIPSSFTTTEPVPSRITKPPLPPNKSKSKSPTSWTTAKPSSIALSAARTDKSRRSDTTISSTTRLRKDTGDKMS